MKKNLGAATWVSLAIAAATFVIVGMTGCNGGFMGNLRRDLNDQAENDEPVTGGIWHERGMLDDEYASVGHSERSLAANGFGGRTGDNSWVSEDRALANRRDMRRGGDDGYDTPMTEDGQPVSTATVPNVLPSVKRKYRNGMRATRADFIDETPNEGSLWASDGQTNYFFTKNKIRGAGDILTIKLEPEMLRDIGLESKRSLTPQEREIELHLAQARLNARANGQPDPDAPVDPKAAPAAGGDTIKTTSAAPAPVAEKKEDKEAREATIHDIDMTRSLEIKSGDAIMAEIVERYPNGNYKIRGMKKIPYKNGAYRMVSVMAIVRNADIGEDDSIQSGKLYEYRLEASR